MAQTNFTPISLYYSTTASAVPVNTNLVNGELAINITDGKLYYKNNSGVVTLLASSTTVTNSFSAGTTGLTPSTATTGAVTLAGTLNVANGGTGLTTLTAGYIPFGAGTSAFGNSANLFWDNANTALGIGTATPNTWTARLSIIGGTNQIAFGDASATSTNYSLLNYGGGSGILSLIANSTGGATAIAFSTSNSATATEKMRLNGLGQLFINGTSGTSLLTIASSATYPALKVPNIVEAANVSATAPTSTTNFYMNNGAVQYITANNTNNWTLNFAFSSTTTLNTAMAVNDSMSCTLVVTNSTTAYYASAFTIDGTSVTPKWQGGTAPSSGNASSIDSYTFVIIKTAASTYTVLASQTKFA